MTDSLDCQTCGRSNEADARFCSGCGSPLEGGAAPFEARRVVTALFADVVGSTALGERLDPEDLQAVVGEGVARIVQTVEELGGHVERVAGDGALVLFGAPMAHEDDAERAVLAGLRTLDAIRDYAREVTSNWGIEDFTVRVGIETGPAVLAPLGRGGQAEFGAMGDVLNTGARLEAAAEPGTVLVGPHTFGLTEHGFEWDKPVELSLKGKAGVVVGHRPRRARTSRGPGLQRGDLAPIVGRERELEALGEALDRLLAGTGGVFIISGDPGLGKTRLLRELRTRLERSSSAHGEPRWLAGRCVSYGERLPYLPFGVLLRDWLGVVVEQSGSHTAALLDTRLAELFGERATDLGALLRPVLGLTPGARDAGRLAGLKPDDAQLRTFVAFAELVERLTREGPVVLALDDLQWADPTSLALAEHLLALGERAPVLVVLAARPERDHSSWRLRERALRDFGHCAQIVELPALGHGADRALLAALAPGAELPQELEQQVLERADGNPLYLEELVRSLIDAGALIAAGSGLRYEREVEIEVPETVEKLILARVDVLSPDARELLCAASVLGRRFTHPLLETVAGDASALAELRHADLVRGRGRRADQEYRFKHHLIREAVYHSMLRRRRVELHRRTAETIEEAFADRLDERLDVLAHHWAAAGDHQRALGYHARAGERAWQIAAVKEALDHYDAAVEAAASIGLSADDVRMRGVLMGRARARLYAGLPQEAVPDMKAAVEGARASGDRQTEMEALSLLAWFRIGGYSEAIRLGEKALALARELEDQRAQVRALTRLAILDSNRLKLDRALAEGTQALELARRGEDEEALGWALDALKLARLKLGDLSAVEILCAELIEINRRRNEPFFLAWATLESTFPLLGAGRLDAALTRAEEALALNRELGDRYCEPVFLDAVCWVQRSRGEYGPALEAGRRATSMAAERGNDEWRAWAAATLGWALLDLRATGEAVPLLEAGAAAARKAQATGEELRSTALLAWAHWLAEDREKALRLAGEAETMLAAVTVPEGGAWLFGAHAQLALARVRIESGDWSRGEALADPLYHAALRAGWKETTAEAAVVLAHCAALAGRLGNAVGLLEGALGAPGAAAPAWEARLLLARLRPDHDGERHAADARALVERVVERLGDDPAASSLKLWPVAAGASM